MGVGVAVGVIDGVGVAVGVINGVGVAVGFGATDAPLFHTNFLPLLMHVNFLPFAVAVDPAFLHTSPALTAAIAFMGTRKSAVAIKAPRAFFTPKG